MTKPSRVRWRLAVFMAMVGACVGAYFAYVAAFGVNVVFWDDWGWEANLLPGYPTLASLWGQHNESIIFFPNLVAIPIIHLTHWNTLAFLWASAVLLVGALAVMIGTFWDEIRKAPLLWLPLPLLVLSLAQYQSTLWAFQIAWFMVLFAVVSAFALLAKPEASMKRLALAALLGAVGSYSLLQGLLVWPGGLLVLLASGRSNRLRVAWCAAGVAVTAGYLADYSFAASGSASLSYVLAHLSVAVKGVLITAGSIIPSTASGIGDISSARVSQLTGAVLLAAGAGSIVVWWVRGRTPGPQAFCVALILTSMLFAVMLIPGRLAENMYAGTTSRYDTFMWPLLLGTYAFAVMERPRTIWRRRWAWAPLLLLSAAVAADAFVSTTVGIEQGQVTRQVRLTSVDVLANWQTAPPAVAAPYLLPPCANEEVVCSELKAAAEVLERDQFSIFSDPSHVSSLRDLGIVPGGVPVRPLAIPATLSGQVNASATSRRAWTVLSAVYRSDPALESEYAQTSHGVTEILLWAIASADEVNAQAIIDAEWYPPVAGGFFLAPYETVYRSWVLSGAS
jgi:hypothetical protein